MIANLLRLFVIARIILSCAADEPVANIEGVLKFPDGSPFNLTSRITMNHDEYTTYSRADGSFVIYNVPPGIHQLDIHSTIFHFSQVKIQLLEDSMDKPKCLEYVYPGANKNPISYPITLTAHATYEYFEQRRGFSLFSIFKNPMFLMMAVSVGMMFLMPKMMEGLEPEEKERMKQQIEMQRNPTKMLSQMWGDFTGAEAETGKGKNKKKN